VTTNSPGRSFDRALDLVRFLRANCEWDAKQTPQTLVPYLLEEAHEVADAIALAHETELARELGDLLLNVAFQAVLAEERGSFTAEDVVAGMEAKMRRRHPHLYGDGPAEDWERLKARERAVDDAVASLLDGVPRGLDPLSRAQRIQDRVSAVGFDWPDPAGALAKIREELAEVEALAGAHGEQAPASSTTAEQPHTARPGTTGDPPGAPSRAAIEEEVGDLLFSVVNAARLLGVHAMTALLRANDKFDRRFRALEALARERGVTLEDTPLAGLDDLWETVKAAESGR
jgi:uncharacterized protein YabN with tetrapyrrole methylase and pyrophosphatase domain